jgi:16S rRNA (guanine966-N2)-methyltransferase
MLRVTAGLVRGFKLEVPSEGEVRPALEMARQAIFNILGQDFEGLRVADLFAGSGIMGIEALSRGAEAALFVERDRVATACITRNLEKTRFSDRAKVMVADAFRPERYLGRGEQFDVVFVDPPFAVLEDDEGRQRLADLVREVVMSPALRDDADVVLRIARDAVFEAAGDGFGVQDDRVYGSSRVLFFSRTPRGE